MQPVEEGGWMHPTSYYFSKLCILATTIFLQHDVITSMCVMILLISNERFELDILKSWKVTDIFHLFHTCAYIFVYLLYIFYI